MFVKHNYSCVAGGIEGFIVSDGQNLIENFGVKNVGDKSGPDSLDFV